MNKVFAFIIVTILYSCGGHITISPKWCSTEATYQIYPESAFDSEILYQAEDPKKWQESSDFFLRHHVWTPQGFFWPEVIELREILKDRNLSCREIKTLSLSFVNSPWDSFSSFVPFLNMRTLYIYGSLNKISEGEKSELNKDKFFKREEIPTQDGSGDQIKEIEKDIPIDQIDSIEENSSEKIDEDELLDLKEES